MDLADTANVHQLADTASNLVDKFVPVSFQVCLLLPCMAEPALVNTPMCQHAHGPLMLSAVPVLANAVRKQIPPRNEITKETILYLSVWEADELKLCLFVARHSVRSPGLPP